MKISNKDFIDLKTGILCIEGKYQFRDYTIENSETKEKVKARCTSWFGSPPISSFEIINNPTAPITGAVNKNKI